jgi:CDP-glucose 4,6-dehydratase
MDQGKGSLENMEPMTMTDENETLFWKSRRVFVTGSTGMVGSWLIKALIRRGANVCALIRDADPQTELYRCGDVERISVISGCVDDYPTLERAISANGIQTVFHLAAQAIVTVAQRSPLPTFETNIRGSYNLLEACRVNKDLIQQVVIASSDKAYGAHETLPYEEIMSLDGRFPYEVSKSCADMLAQSYSLAYELPISVVRCGNIFGGGDLNWSRIIPGTIRSLLKGESPVIRSDGKFIRDYIYVKDVATAYMRIANVLHKTNGTCFNISNETPNSVLNIVNILIRLMHCEHIKPQILNQVKGEEIFAQYLSASKAKKLIDWRPGYTLEEGLVETIDWYKNYFGA